MAPSKRIQVMLRPEIAEIVEDMVEQYSSASKVCSMLVEFALAQKGYWDPVARQRITPDSTPQPTSSNELFESLPSSVVAETVMTKTKQPQPDPEITPELIALAHKLQALQSVGLL